MKARMVSKFVTSATMPIKPRNTHHVMVAGGRGSGFRTNDERSKPVEDVLFLLFEDILPFLKKRNKF